MFVHSVAVPRLYKDSAKFLQQVRESGLGFKQGLFNLKHRNKKAIYELVAGTIKHFSHINELIEKVGLLSNEKGLSPWLARILIFELLWRKPDLAGDSKPIQTILSYQAQLEKHKKEKPDDVEEVIKPRFIRINTLKLSVEDAINGFRDEGWNLVRCNSPNYEDFLSQVSSLADDEFMVDFHIKDLLIFPHKTSFNNHQAYIDKMIVMQDKASCFPVRLLNPPPNSIVLDMCAAPGMKTTYLAALIENKGSIYAIEQSPNRFGILNANVEETGASCIKTINKDALKVTAEECPGVEYILVDPSCSGSGMTSRILLDGKESKDETRLKGLARLQIIILKHALLHFPQAKRVVYSTCSVYREENEEVVEEVLKQTKKFRLVSAKHLLNKKCSFGTEEEEDETVSGKCINLNYEKHLTNGFFVAVFERIEDIKDNKKETKNEVNLNEPENCIARIEESYNTQPGEQPKRKKNKNDCKDNAENKKLEIEAVVETDHNKKKRKRDEDEVAENKQLKKHKKSKHKLEDFMPEEQEANTIDLLKPKKEKHENNNELNAENVVFDESTTDGPKKKHMKCKQQIEENFFVVKEEVNLEAPKKKKRTKESQEKIVVEVNEVTIKKKKHKNSQQLNDENNIGVEESNQKVAKKKKETKVEMLIEVNEEISKKKKHKNSKQLSVENNITVDESYQEVPIKKHKKIKEVQEVIVKEVNFEAPKKKKQKHENKEEIAVEVNKDSNIKKKHKNSKQLNDDNNILVDENNQEVSRKKRKKNKEGQEVIVEEVNLEVPRKKKQKQESKEEILVEINKESSKMKKHKNSKQLNDDNNILVDENNQEVPRKKGKRNKEGQEALVEKVNLEVPRKKKQKQESKEEIVVEVNKESSKKKKLLNN